MCSITEHYRDWAMNIESDASKAYAPSLRNDIADEAMVQSPSLSMRSGGVAPEELPKGYLPSPADVCCGRGKKNWRHHGNAMFRKLIHANVAGYMKATTKNDKTLVVKSIVDIIRQNGGRFLKKDSEGVWHDIGDSQAKEKVGHSLRDQVTALSKQKKDPPSASASPRRPSTTSFSSYSTQNSAAHASSSFSPLNLSSQGLPASDLSRLLEQTHFPSIQTAADPLRLETSQSSFSTVGHPVFHSSYPRFYDSAHEFHSSGQGFPNSSQGFHHSMQSLHESSQNFHNPQQNMGASFSQNMVNFFEPFDDSLEPTPLREFEGTEPDDVDSQRHPSSDR